MNRRAFLAAIFGSATAAKPALPTKIIPMTALSQTFAACTIDATKLRLNPALAVPNPSVGHAYITNL